MASDPQPPDYKAEAREFRKAGKGAYGCPCDDVHSMDIDLAALLERLCGEARKAEEAETLIWRKLVDDLRQQLAEAQKEIERLKLDRDILLARIGDLEKAEVAIEQGKDEKQAAENLLAVLHRDGGHHTGKVGFIQSCRDGELVRHDLMRQIEQAREEGRREQREKMLAIVDEHDCEEAREREQYCPCSAAIEAAIREAKP